MIIRMKNENGTFEIGGGKHVSARLQQITGLGLVSKAIQSLTYSQMPGRVITSERASERTITLKFDYYADPETVIRFFKILQKPMKLELLRNGYYREIDCRVIAGAENNNIVYHHWEEMTLQLECSDPYFRGAVRRESIVSATDMLPNVFENSDWYIQLPAVATVRHQDALIMNDGDTIVYPTITVENLADTTGAKTDTITITINDRVLKIYHHAAVDETVTFNLERRMITSSVDGDITNQISDDTVLSDMYYDEGSNVVTVTSSLTGDNLYAVSRYSPLYGMAVI